MPILGAHKSIAGGYFKAILRACQSACDCVQLFTKNNNQWRAKPISPEEARQFRQVLTERPISHLLAHDAYLINLASPDRLLWQRSVDSFVGELQRAEILGIPYVVAHPGAFIEGGPQAGIRRVVRALNRIHRLARGTATKCLLETTAGQGTSLGWRFEDFAQILESVREPDLLGVCFDTCHVFAAGYPLATAGEYAGTMEALDRHIGIHCVKAFHLNDSAKERGARVDRHAHIGRGKMGLEPFRNLLNDPRFREIPMHLETPKDGGDGRDLDAVNLAILRGLVE